MEDQLTNDGDLLHVLLASATDRIYFKDTASRFLKCSHSLATRLGLSDPREIVGKTDFDLHPKERAQEYFNDEQRIIRTGEPLVDKVEAQAAPNGAIVWASVTKVPIRNRAGTITGIVGISRDITERKRAEEALRQSQQWQEQLVNSIDGIVWELDVRTFRFLFVSRKAERLLGYPVAQWLNEPNFWQAHILSEDRDWALGYCVQATREMKDHELEYRMVAADGHAVWLRDLVTVVVEDNKVTKLRGVMMDITDRKQIEERVREQAGLLEQARDAIIVVKLDDRIAYWNKGAEDLYGWKAAEVIDCRFADILYRVLPAEESAAQKIILESGAWHGEVQHATKAGGEVIVESRRTLLRDEQGGPKSVLVINTDITAKRRLEEQFLRVQRIENLGLLAAGVAHDLNNILAPIMMGAPLLRLHATEPSDLQVIETLEKSAARGGALVRQILAFSHDTSGPRREISLKAVVREILDVIEATFSKSIQREDQISSDLWLVKANPTQIHQVLLNFCVNARDAMPQGGSLCVKLENRMIEAERARAFPGCRAGAHVMLEVSDTGVGIAPAILSRIWEPFFTTKSPDKGTGLGLSTVRGIVESHGGWIEVQSELGRGSTFRVYLPAVDAPAGGVSRSDHPFIVPGRDELLLVVDDEGAVRDLTATILTRHHYRTLTARDGAEALALFAQTPSEIRLVITDLDMPNIGGATLAQAIHRIAPSVKVLAMSGISSSSVHEQAAAADAFLRKPFDADGLLLAVHRLLHGPPSKAGRGSAG